MGGTGSILKKKRYPKNQQKDVELAPSEVSSPKSFPPPEVSSSDVVLINKEQMCVIVVNQETCYAGFGGTSKGTPRSVDPFVAYHPHPNKYYGETALHHLKTSTNPSDTLIPLLQHGKLTRPDLLDNFWNYLFSEALRISPEDHPILMTIPPLASPEELELVTRIAFETFNIQEFHVSWDVCLSSAYDRVWLSVNVYSDYMVVVPVYYGSMMREAMISVDYGYGALYSYVLKVLKRNFSDFDEKEMGAKDLLKEMFNGYHFKYKLEEGELENCKEPFFNPSLLGLPQGTKPIGIHEMIISSIDKTPIELHEELYESISIRGIFPREAKERLIQELTRDSISPECKIAFLMGGHPRLGAHSPVRVLSPDVLRKIFSFLPISRKFKPTRVGMNLDPYQMEYGAWSGANVNHASLPYITSELYSQTGPKCIHRLIY